MKNTSKENTKPTKPSFEDSVREFLSISQNARKQFRYYETREIEEAMKNHMCTTLSYHKEKKDVPVAYGHLDVEDGTVWLGICVADEYQGQRYGLQMMQILLDYYNGEIKLSVDNDNKRAISLYEKFHFKTDTVDGNIRYMVREAAKSDTYL